MRFGMRLPKSGLALALAFALAGCAPGARAPESAKPDAAARLTAGVTRTVLDNGLTVLTREMHEVPVVTTMVWYRIGAADEAEGETGIAHFLEHMMFKGTDRFAKGEIDHVTQRNGGRNNAFTAKERTVYFFDFASDRWDAALEIESSRMRGCLLDEKEFQTERQVVIEELRRRLDTPWEKLEQEMEPKAFPGHAYAHPVIGWKKDLDVLTRDRMAGYYNRYYQPNNAVLVLAGDFDTPRALARVRELFGKIPRAPRPEPKARAAAGPVSDHAIEIQSTHNLDRLLISWRAAAFGAPDDAALDVLSTALGSGKSSRLYRRLVEDDRLVADISCWVDPMRVDGLLSVGAELLPEKGFSAAEKSVADEVAKLVKEPLPERELQKAKNMLLADFAFSKETTHGMANALGHFEIMKGFEYIEAYRDKIERVTAADLQAAARTYLCDAGRITGRSKAGKGKEQGRGMRGIQNGEGRMRNAGNGSPLRACAWTGGAEESGDVRSVDVGGGTPFARRVPRLAGFAPEPEAGAAPGAAVFKLPPIRREVLPNGLTVLALPRPGTPSLALRIFVDAGLLVEPEAKAGVAKVVSELLLEGTARRTGREIADAIEFVGGSLDASPTGVTGKVLWRDGDLLLDLAADALQHPVFPADAFARVREQTLSEIEGEEDHPATVGRNLFYETIYGAHPMHRPSHGYKRTVEALTRDDAVAHHAAFCRPRNAVVAVVGDAPPEALIGQVRRHFGGWADNGPAAKPSLPEVARQTEPKAVEKKVDSAQAHIYVGHLGIRRNDPDYHALLVMDQVLGLGAGFTDRLSKRVRDELGLAYQVYGTITHTATVEPGPFQIYAGTRPQKKDEAVREIQATLKRFVDEGPTGDELREVKAYLLGSYVFEYETASSLADYLISVERFGLGLDYLQRYPGLVAAVTRDDVVRVAKKHLDPASLTTVVVWRGKAEESKETR